MPKHGAKRAACALLPLALFVHLVPAAKPTVLLELELPLNRLAIFCREVRDVLAIAALHPLKSVLSHNENREERIGIGENRNRILNPPSFINYASPTGRLRRVRRDPAGALRKALLPLRSVPTWRPPNRKGTFAQAQGRRRCPRP